MPKSIEINVYKYSWNILSEHAQTLIEHFCCIYYLFLQLQYSLETC